MKEIKEETPSKKPYSDFRDKIPSCRSPERPGMTHTPSLTSFVISIMAMVTPRKNVDTLRSKLNGLFKTGTFMEETPAIEKWLLHVDRSSTIQGSDAGIVITSPKGEDLEFAVKFGFEASKNEAEYEALVIGMKMAHEAGARHLVAYSDSQLVLKQVEDTYEAKEETMI
ncbi:UNVERIFIED_CONTAM: hypothetical protein Scaly_2578100 [Sesamum calycinum]|uniref:RNase H type-1 domain-containing protein n=1 Tax=Sesamum calycinum TaxID=2727403 RepID=A0AAW2JEN1_9LAMI